MSCTVTPSSTQWKYGHAIWVDWNKDYEFTSDERVAYTTSTATGNWTGSVAVPSDANGGDYRMRVIHFYNNTPTNACMSDTYGEAEDYKLTVIATTYTQTTTLSEDWNWWSSNLDITLGELKEALGSHGLRIAAQDGKFATYNANSGTWSGNLQSIELGKMYKIRTTETCTITFSGEVLDPAEHSITLSSGNNWIGFIGTQSMSLDQAFGNFTPTDRDVIKAANGKATYYQGYGWQGSLNTLEPGHGYIYKSNATETRTFTYPSAK